MTGITATDLFCGAGGSTSGLKSSGVRVVMAANHWRRAIETHSANHPETEHDCADLRAVHPSAYQRTDILTASPECTNHSLAKGRARKNIHQLDLWGDNRVDPAEERSRATMREVVEFAEFHRYKVIIVENVVEIAYWQHYDAWIEAMVNLGYDHRPLYLNAQFFGVPQSRDRVYVVFWLRGMKKPNLDFRFPAACPDCGLVEAYQSFKKTRQWGRYGANRQYIYRCSACHKAVHPFHTPAAVAIDWTLPVQRIADRARPLQPKTMQRIEAGLKKLHGQPVVVNTSFTHAADANKVSGLHEPMPTQTVRQSLALNIPPLFLNMKGPNIAESVEKPLGALTTIDSHCFIPTPAAWLTSVNHSTNRNTPIDRPMPTVMPHTTPSLAVAPWLVTMRENNQARELSEPMGTVTTWGGHGLVYPFMVTLRQHTEARNITDPLTSVTAGGTHHALITPWMLTLRQSAQQRPIDEPLSTVSAGGNNHALIYSYYGQTDTLQPTSNPLPTVVGTEKHALINEMPRVEDCGFRMLEPHELKLAMGFDDSYIVTGNKRDQVKQIGNAVACPVMEAISRRCVEALLAS